jgi:VWFA-related protein
MNMARRGPSFVIHLLSTVLAASFCVLPDAAQDCKSCSGPVPGISGVLPGITNNHFSKSGSVPGDAGDIDNAWTIRKRVDEVTVFFTATKGHKFIDDLTAAEVSVTDDNRPPARISAFGHQRDLPLRLALLIDTSDSVQHRFNFEREAATRFLQKMVRPETDLAFVMGFSDETVLTQDYTDDTDKLASGVWALRSKGDTALFQAVRASCFKLGRATDHGLTARVLVLLSDGDDNASTSTLEQSIETAQREEVTIYSISTNHGHENGPGDKVLESLAVQTGGQIFLPNGAKDVVKAFLSIEHEMRSRYALAYQPADLREDGRFHRIEIRAQRFNKKLHVHARKGYYARLDLSDK